MPGLLLAVTFHEFAHGFTAYLMGDKTAQEHGRLTLNPLRHLDVAGTLMLIMFGFGWGKPVPIGSERMKNVRLGVVLVSLAGPFTNILLAAFLGQLYKLFTLNSFLGVIFYAAATINLFLAVFNLIPLPPLDGSRVVMALLPRSLARKYAMLEGYGIAILFLIILFGSSYFYNFLRLPVDYLTRFLL